MLFEKEKSMFILVVILIGAAVAFAAYSEYEENRGAEQFESLFKDLMEKLKEMGEDLYDFWRDEPFRIGEVRSRPSDGGLFPDQYVSQPWL